MSVLSFRCQHAYPAGFHLDVGFDVDHPFTALFGPSGSGKTSILNMIAGFLRPQQGTIRLGDRILLDTARGVSLPPEKRHVGVVFQDSLLFPHLTVAGNLRYGQRRRDKRGAQARLRAGGRGAGNRAALAAISPQPVRWRATARGPGAGLAERPRIAADGRTTGFARRPVARPRAVLSSSGPLRNGTSRPSSSPTPRPRFAVRPSGWSSWKKGGWSVPARRRTPSVSRNRWPGPIRPAPSACSGWRKSNRREALARPTSATKCCNFHLAQRRSALPSFVQFSPTDVIIASQDVAGLSPHGTTCEERFAGSSLPSRPFL